MVLQFISVGLMTPNLHDLLCQLHLQELSLGDTVALLELWVEGIIQCAKKRVKGRSVKHLEVVMVNDILVGNSLDLNKHIYGAPLQTLQEMKAAKAAQKPLSMTDIEKIDPNRGIQGLSAMSDTGRRVRGSEKDKLMDEICKMFTNSEPEEDDVEAHAQWLVDGDWLHSLDVGVWVHKEAVVEGEFRINCTAYKLQQSRESFWVLANYTPQMPGSVELFVRVPLPPAEDGSPRFLRVAMCKFWKFMSPLVDADLGDRPTYRFMLDKPELDLETGLTRLYALELESIVAPLFHTSQNVISASKPGVVREQYLFACYNHLSGLK